MIETEEIVRVEDDRIDELEAAMLELEPIDCPLIHRFTDKMYIREIYMPAGTLVTSKIHKTNHPFVLSKGKVSVKIDNGEWVTMEAPFSDTTKIGTRRILYIWEDAIWSTFHVNLDNTTDLEEIENRILEPHTNSVIGEDINKIYKELLNNKKELL